MKKKTYIKPTVQVIVLRHLDALLVGSMKLRSAPEDAPDYDDEFSFIPAGPADMNRMA